MGESYKFGYWGKTSEEILNTQFPLHRCCRDGDVEGLSTLLDHDRHGIFVEDSFYGWTPAHWAAYFGKLGCLRKLLHGHLDGHVATTRFQQTPAHVAAYGGHPTLLQWLLQAGARLDDKDYLGETALHKSARTGSMECVSLLVAHGADLSIMNNNLHTPSQLAKACGYYECARYLNDVLEQRSNSVTSPPNIQSEDCDMDCVDSTSPTNGLATTSNGAGDGFHHSNPSPSNGIHHSNGHAGDGDILLFDGVGRNHVAVAGRKRPREEVEMEDGKRMRTEVEPVDVADPITDISTVDRQMSCDEDEPRDCHVTGDVLFAIGACMSPSASILSVSTHSMRRNHHNPENSSPSSTRKRCVFAV